MHEVVRMPDPKLEELFLLTAEQMAMPPGIVEKDSRSPKLRNSTHYGIIVPSIGKTRTAHGTD